MKRVVHLRLDGDRRGHSLCGCKRVSTRMISRAQTYLPPLSSVETATLVLEVGGTVICLGCLRKARAVIARGIMTLLKHDYSPGPTDADMRIKRLLASGVQGEG